MSEDRSNSGSLPVHTATSSHELQVSIINQLLSPGGAQGELLIPHQGTQAISLGMHTQDILAALGPPDETLDLNEYLEDEDPFFSVSLDYYGDGIEVLTKSDRVVGIRFYTGNADRKPVRNFYGFDGRLATSLPLDCRQHEVIEALGEPVEMDRDDQDMAESLSIVPCATLRYDGIEIRCRLDDGRVLNALIGAAM